MKKTTKKNKCINYQCYVNITSKRHNILPTRTSFFISNAGQIESVQELIFLTDIM